MRQIQLRGTLALPFPGGMIASVSPLRKFSVGGKIRDNV